MWKEAMQEPQPDAKELYVLILIAQKLWGPLKNFMEGLM